MSIRSIGANGRTPLSGDEFNEAKVLAKLLPTRGGRHANPHWFALEPDCYFPGRASPAISLQNQGSLPTLLMQNCNEKKCAVLSVLRVSRGGDSQCTAVLYTSSAPTVGHASRFGIQFFLRGSGG